MLLNWHFWLGVLLAKACFAVGLPMEGNGIIIVVSGASLNRLVVKLNGNRMPVRAHVYADDDTYVTINERTRLVFLSDVIPWRSGYASIGDVVMILGLALAIFGDLIRHFATSFFSK